MRLWFAARVRAKRSRCLRRDRPLALRRNAPPSLYSWFFGDEFVEAKSILMFLSPGVLAVAISNVWGHYFSAFGELKILILKSFSGVVVAFVLSLVLVPALGVEGACWVNLMANLVCSLVLGVAYFFDKKQVAK